MSLRSILLLTALGLAPLAAGADARPRDREPDAIYKGTKQGRILPLRLIEQKIVPRMGDAEYLGPEIDPGATVYRLKFMRQGRVIWIDIDARTGHVIGRSDR